MTYVVLLTQDMSYARFLSRSYRKTKRGRKNSQKPRPWSWSTTWEAPTAYFFDDLAEAIKQAIRAVNRFPGLYDRPRAEVWLYESGAAKKRVWPADVVDSIGLLAGHLDEANIEVP